MEVEQWLLVWFEKNTDFTYNIIQEKAKTSFILERWIDSLKFISLITEIEEHFKIKFSGLDQIVNIFKKKYIYY